MNNNTALLVIDIQDSFKIDPARWASRNYPSFEENVTVLIRTFRDLIDRGNSVLVIEHNTQLIEHADWVIDLGPEGGEAGGRVVAQGTPEQVARAKTSHTGRFLADLVGPNRKRA